MTQIPEDSTATSQVKCAVSATTPEMMRSFLTRNIQNNRPVNKDRVAQYASDMLAGRWRLGESLKFDTNGNLFDGQHRAHAVIRAGITVPMLICTGYPPESVTGIDVGGIRTVSHIAKVAGLGNIPSYCFAALSCLSMDLGIQSGATLPRRYSKAQLIDLYKHYELFFNWLQEVHSRYQSGPKARRSNNSAVLAIIMRAWFSENRKRLAEFIGVIDDVISADDLTVRNRSAAEQLRRWLVSNPMPNGNKACEYMRRTQHALNKFLRHETLSTAPQAVVQNLFRIELPEALFCNPNERQGTLLPVYESNDVTVFDRLDSALWEYLEVGETVEFAAEMFAALGELAYKEFDEYSPADVRLLLLGNMAAHPLLLRLDGVEAVIGKTQKPILTAIADKVIRDLLNAGKSLRLYPGRYTNIKTLLAEAS